jgi:hypothetical protein
VGRIARTKNASSEQSIFDQDTFLETTSILKEALDTIDKNTYYKDTDYWGLYEAIETFLYGELNPGLDDGDYWGIKGFSLIWEDMCNTYFFRKHKAEICYADTDIPLKDHDNPLPQRREEKNRVGNCAIKVSNGSIFWQQWIYSTESDKAEDDIQELKWHQLLVIEFNLNPRHLVLTNGAVAHPDYQEDYGYDTENSISLRRKFLRPDLVLTNRDFNLRIIDYKDVPLEFYLNPSNLSPKEQNKYKHDIIKQLTYELALQQTHTVSENLFFLPYYYESPPINDLGEVDPSLDIKGIRVFKANFFLIQSEYLQENLL